MRSLVPNTVSSHTAVLSAKQNTENFYRSVNKTRQQYRNTVDLSDKIVYVDQMGS